MFLLNSVSCKENLAFYQLRAVYLGTCGSNSTEHRNLWPICLRFSVSRNRRLRCWHENNEFGSKNSGLGYGYKMCFEHKFIRAEEIICESSPAEHFNSELPRSMIFHSEINQL